MPAVEVELQDNGLGADRVAGDGLYAKYFIDFVADQVKLQLMNPTRAEHLKLSSAIKEVWLEVRSSRDKRNKSSPWTKQRHKRGK